MINFNYVNYIENWDKNNFLCKCENVYAKRALLLLRKMVSFLSWYSYFINNKDTMMPLYKVDTCICAKS